jgi:hypothetical protein
MCSIMLFIVNLQAWAENNGSCLIISVHRQQGLPSLDSGIGLAVLYARSLLVPSSPSPSVSPCRSSPSLSLLSLSGSLSLFSCPSASSASFSPLSCPPLPSSIFVLNTSSKNNMHRVFLSEGEEKKQEVVVIIINNWVLARAPLPQIFTKKAPPGLSKGGLGLHVDDHGRPKGDFGRLAASPCAAITRT